MNHLPTLLRRSAALVAVMLAIGVTPARADEIRYGDFKAPLNGTLSWKIWQDGGFDGYSAMWRNDANTQFAMWWDAKNGKGTLPRFGRTAENGNSGWSKKARQCEWPMNVRYRFVYDNWGTPPKTGCAVWIGAYGWLDDSKPVKWPWTVEFYVIENWDGYKPAPAEESPLIGTYWVDGSEYEVFKNETPIGAEQWISVRRQRRSAGTITLRKHLDVWGSYNMPNHYVAAVELGVEAIGGNSNGSVYYSGYEIADP